MSVRNANGAGTASYLMDLKAAVIFEVCQSVHIVPHLGIPNTISDRRVMVSRRLFVVDQRKHSPRSLLEWPMASRKFFYL